MHSLAYSVHRDWLAFALSNRIAFDYKPISDKRSVNRVNNTCSLVYLTHYYDDYNGHILQVMVVKETPRSLFFIIYVKKSKIQLNSQTM